MSYDRDRYRELRSSLSGDDVDEDVAEEMAHHLAMRIEEGIAAGLSPEEARAAALRRFGDVERVRSRTHTAAVSGVRARRRLEVRDGLSRELRQALRGLARSRGFSATVFLTLALGLGAAAAIFALLDGVVLDPLPYPAAERLVWLDSPVPAMGEGQAWGLSETGYHRIAEDTRAFEAVGAFTTGQTTLRASGESERVRTAAVTRSLLDVLSAVPFRGRLFTAEDDAPGGPAVVLLSHDYWRARFGADPRVVGRTLELGGNPHEVIGVLPPAFQLPSRDVDVWRPFQLDPAATPQNSHYLQGLARLRPGVDAAAAQADVERVTGQFTTLFPGAYSDAFMRDYGFTTRAQPLKEKVLGEITQRVWILFGSVLLLLLIAAVNVANLFLVRTEARRRELAIRGALGAERGQLALHYLTESLLLALAGGVAGLGLGQAALAGLLAIAPEGVPRLAEVAIGWETVLFTLALATLGGLVFGLFPVLWRARPHDDLRDGSRGLTASRGRARTRRVLVTGQVAVAVLLMAAAGLLVRSFAHLRAVDPGMDPRGGLAAEVVLPYSGYGGFEEAARFHRALQERLAGLPGVTAVGVGSDIPLEGGGTCATMSLEGRPMPGEEPPCIPYALATPGYFEATGIQVRGRTPTWADVDVGTGAVVVTRTLAERLWPGEDALGRGIRGNGDGPPYYRVVGVTEELRGRALEEPPLEMVFFPPQPIEGAPLWMPLRSAYVVVRSSSDDAMAALPGLRAAVREIDSGVPVATARTLDRIVADSMGRTTFPMLLIGTAAAMALLLSAVGLYGVISYTVGQRRGEMGIRLALGARAGQLRGLVLASSLGLVAVGIALGLAAALVAGRFIQSLLFGVQPADPPTLAAVAALLVGVSLLAAWLPARRAARLDPATVLREQ